MSGLLWLKVPVPLICTDALSGAPLVSSVTKPVRMPPPGVFVAVGVKVLVGVGVFVAPPGVGVGRHGFGAEALLRGVGGFAVLKSAELFSVSVQPPLARTALVGFVRVGAAAVSKSLA